MNTNKPVTERNLNFELLRIIAMFMVVMLHVNSFGGLLYEYKPDLYPFPFLISNFFEYLCIIAVNLYVLISGYFLSGKSSPFKLEKALKLIFITVFWSWIIGGLSCLFLEANVNDFLFNGIFPIMSSRYWFVTDYIILYMLSPFYNIVLQSLNKTQHLWLLSILLFFFSVVQFLWEPVELSKGYSLYWFSYLYVQASFIRKYNVKFSFKILLLLWGGILLFQLIGTYFTKLYGFNYINSRVFNLNYNSLFILVSSTCCFLLFKSLTIKRGKKIICLLSSLTLGVYLIHINPATKFWLFKELLPIKSFAGTQAYNVLAALLLFTIIIFSVSCIFEYMRIQLFNLFKIDSKVENLSSFIEKKVIHFCKTTINQH